MKGFVSFVAMAGMVAGPVQVQAQEAAPRVFEAAGPWTLDFAEDYCRLARIFTNGTDQLAVAFERARPEGFTRLIVVGSGIRLYRRANTVGYSYAPSGENRTTQLLRSDTDDGQDYLNFGNIFFAPPFTPGQVPEPYNRQKEQDFAAGVEGIALGEGLTEPVTIQTGSMKEPVAALQTCADDLLTEWGLDAEKHRTMTRPVMPKEDISKWLARGTIGFQDFGKLGGGMNPFRLLVDEGGKATACHVTWPSLAAGTNDKICKMLIANGEFEPALDAAGQPMASFWTVEPFFLLPPPPGAR